MADTDDQPITADEYKAAVSTIRRAVSRLPQSYHADQADKAVDTVRDSGLRALESKAGTGYPGKAISGH